mmetsp:Transcript_23748/g.35606  ORF Transcript_23748/g.35606 Transcript_23748/m.35606 type:complete len:722 (+) Transcript_23748:76-2241(+)
MSLQHRKAMALLIFGAAVIIFFSLSLSDSRKIRVRIGTSRMRNVTVFNHGPGKNQKMKRSAQPEGLIFESKHKRKAPSNDSDYEPKNSTREKAMDTRSTEDMEMWGRQMRLVQTQVTLKMREEKMRDEKNQLGKEKAELTRQLGVLRSAYLVGNISKEEHDNLSAPLNTQIAGTQKGIQAVETKLEDLTKKLDDESARGRSGWSENTEINAVDPEMLAFFKALFVQNFTNIDDPCGEDTPTKKKYAILDLKEAPLFGNPDYSTKLYVRNEIFELYEIIKQKFVNNKRRIFIGGSSGIGKSTAAPLVLKMLREWKPMGALLQCMSSYYWIPKDFPESEIVAFDNLDAVKRWRRKNLLGKSFYNFMDPDGSNKICGSFTNAYEVLWVSPKRAGKMGERGQATRDVHDWGKEAYKLYMRHWDPIEIIDCNERCYNMNPEIVKEKIGIWGPVPRQIFGPGKFLEKLLGGIDSEQIRGFFLGNRGEGTPDGIKDGKIVHLIPSEDRRWYYYRVATSHIARELLCKYDKVIKQLAKDLVSNAARGTTLASLAAAFWLEALVTIKFTTSSFTLKARQLKKRSIRKPTGNLTVEIRKMKHKLFGFADFRDVEFKSNTYYEPNWRTLESIDSLFVIGNILYLVQITYKTDHPLKAPGIKRVWTAAKNKVPNLEGYCVIFVVPSELSAKQGKDLLATYKYQDYKQTTNNSVDYSKAPFKFEKGQYLFVFKI